MTREQAVKWLKLLKTSPLIYGEYPQAIDMAIEALTERTKGEWIFNPKDAIELMFTKPKCSECGFESSDGGNFCSNCGARMKGGAE